MNHSYFDTENSSVRIFKVTLKVENGMSTTESVRFAGIHPSPGRVQDVKFVDDENIMLAVIGECMCPSTLQYNRKYKSHDVHAASSHLANIKYRQSNGHEGLTYANLALNNTIDEESISNNMLIDLARPSPLLRHSFPKDPGWSPERMEINGRDGRRAVCVLAQDALRYRVYELDSAPNNDEETMEITDD